jgi:hypothetical protein
MRLAVLMVITHAMLVVIQTSTVQDTRYDTELII